MSGRVPVPGECPCGCTDEAKRFAEVRVSVIYEAYCPRCDEDLVDDPWVSQEDAERAARDHNEEVHGDDDHK